MSVIFVKNILVVEDDRSTAKILKLRLESAGYKVFTENLGLSALSFAAEHPLDLVIVDIKLPDISGFEVCSRLRKIHGPKLPILILTGLKQPEDQLEGFDSGADAYLTKPYDSQELLQTVELLLGIHERKPKPGKKLYLSIEEVAKHLGVNVTTVYRLVQRGALPGFKVGAQWRFSLELLESWVADQVMVEWLRAEDKVSKDSKQEVHHDSNEENSNR